MTDYETPKVPPATPPVIDGEASAKDARDKADAAGDSPHSGSVTADGESSERAEEIRAANHAISRGNAKHGVKDGAGEQELDSMQPETLLPPD